MAFLSSEARFAAIDAICKDQRSGPGPGSYNSLDSWLDKHPRQLDAIDRTDKAIRDVNQTVCRPAFPGPGEYSAKVEGEFPKLYTMQGIEDSRAIHHRLRPQPTKPSKAAVSALKVRLGPGSYDLDKDWGLERISAPCSFPKSKRQANIATTIKTRSSWEPNASTYRPELTSAKTMNMKSELANEVHKTHHITAALMRSHSTSEMEKIRNASSYSKQLAISYKEMDKSMKKLARQLSSPTLRQTRYQRFATENDGRVEIYLRSSNRLARFQSGRTIESNFKTENSRPLFDETKLEKIKRKKAPQSANVSAHTDRNALGSGSCDYQAFTLDQKSFNILYQPRHTQRERRYRNAFHCAKGKEHMLPVGSQNLKELWKEMQRRPTLPDQNSRMPNALS